jgi:anthranilate phosphoribosyltransferase
VLDVLIKQLAQGQPLDDEQVGHAVEELVSPTIHAAIKADFLTTLARKGETIPEIAAFARQLRSRSIEPPIDSQTRGREILDVCGTGGDRLNTFNISTTVALVAACADVPVAKHGNRAITSQAGSADVLEALGIAIELEPQQAASWLSEHHFAFFFAPKYHPSFREIGPARKLCAQRGQRTIFNFLGPLLNPARPSAQLIGVPEPQLCEKVAAVLQALGVRRAMVVCGAISHSPETSHCDAPPAGEQLGVKNLDELSTLGDNCIAEFYHQRGLAKSTLRHNSFPLQPATLADLEGGDRAANAEIVRSLLTGRERGPKRDAILLNSAAALFVAGKAGSLTEGWDLAGQLIDSGCAEAKLRHLVEASGAVRSNLRACQ